MQITDRELLLDEIEISSGVDAEGLLELAEMSPYKELSIKGDQDVRIPDLIFYYDGENFYSNLEAEE